MPLHHFLGPSSLVLAHAAIFDPFPPVFLCVVLLVGLNFFPDEFSCRQRQGVPPMWALAPGMLEENSVAEPASRMVDGDVEISTMGK